MSNGSSWHALYQDEETILQRVEWLLVNGRLADRQPVERPGEPHHIYLTADDHPLGLTAVIRTSAEAHEFVSGYPTALDHSENELEVLDAASIGDEDEFYDGIEGTITAITRDGAQLVFACPDWLFWRDELAGGGRFKTGLGALAYMLERAPTEVEVSEGSLFEMEKDRLMAEDPEFNPATFGSLTVDLGNLRTYLARGDGDIEFQTVVEAVTPFSALGAEGFTLTVNLASVDREPIAVKLHATRLVLGEYDPAVGDSVRGVARLQGTLLEKVSAEDSWLDSAEAAHGSDDDGFTQMVEFIYSNPQLPLAVQAVGSALRRAGWVIMSLEDRIFRPAFPSIVASWDGQIHLFFIRSNIPGFCGDDFLEGKHEWYETNAAERGLRCVWVSVDLIRRGKNYRVEVEGLVDMPTPLTVPFELASPEFSQLLKIDTQTPGGIVREPEPVLDEANAAAVFAACMGRGDLRDFSCMLVEDATYVSEPMAVTVLGRQQILGYFGDKLDTWGREQRTFQFMPGLVEVDGVEKRCVVTTDGRGALVGCTVFTGRRGHIAGMRHLKPVPGMEPVIS